MATEGGSGESPPLKKATHLREEVLRKEFLAMARKKCDPLVAMYAKCAKEQGLLVPFKCREENRQMESCLSAFTTNDRYALYKEARCVELGWEVPQGLLKDK